MQNNLYLGKQIGNYRITSEIASGSFGSVFLAHHVYLKQRIAVIKLLHAVHLGSEEEKEQFLQEAQILEMLKGMPHILPLLDVGIDENTPYLITEYAELGSLRQRLMKRGGGLPVQDALTIITQVGEGLQNAHNQNIVHRDLKPENILFNAKNEALLADFGISTVLSTTSIKLTAILGTPAYMAPEQFRGEVSKESDQYALGCIAYELLTGKKPFNAQDFVAMGFLHTSEKPTPPRQYNQQIPSGIEYAILRAMSKQRSDRFARVEDFVRTLQAELSLAEDVTDVMKPASQAAPATPPLLQASGQQPVKRKNTRPLSASESAAIASPPVPAVHQSSFSLSQDGPLPSTLAEPFYPVQQAVPQQQGALYPGGLTPASAAAGPSTPQQMQQVYKGVESEKVGQPNYGQGKPDKAQAFAPPAQYTPPGQSNPHPLQPASFEPQFRPGKVAQSGSGQGQVFAPVPPQHRPEEGWRANLGNQYHIQGGPRSQNRGMRQPGVPFGLRCMAFLFYILPVISWIFYFRTFTQRYFARFHFMQSLLGWSLWLILITLFKQPQHPVLSPLIGFVFLLMLLFALISTLIGQCRRILIIGNIAHKFAQQRPRRF